jgi:RNA polymerase sigma-70 factor (ECF subfamily)
MIPKSQQSVQDSRQEAEFGLTIFSLRLPLRGYLYTLVPDQAACDDLVQETLLFLWERRADADRSSSLKAWAFKVAWFKALAWRRDHQRERLVYFSEDILQQLAPVAEEISNETETRLAALRHCLARLSPEELGLLRLKYVDRGSLTDHATASGWKPNRVQKMISRLRLALRHCVQKQLQSMP